jgi:dienelactone hydrolase
MRPVTLLLPILGAVMTLSPLHAEFPEPENLPAQKEFPDPLVAMDGKRIADVPQWRNKRRPELKALFEHYMYGELPKVPVKVTGKVLHSDDDAFDGKATLREIQLSIADGCPPIYLLLVVPKAQTGAKSVFVGMNFCGNHALVADPKIRLPDAKTWMYPQYPGVKNNRASDDGRGKQIDVWAIDQTIARGYAVATFYNGDVDPDRNDMREGMRPWLAEKGVKTSTIMAWAWGIHRVVDYLVTVPELDRLNIAVVGHSRLGKTALVAAAFDERIALAIPHQAGCGGTAPDRCHNPKAETVARINKSFPHWFNDNFKKFNDATDKLPFDQHCLVALCGPRPVLFTNAVEDQWANPDGQFEILKAAEPVYKFLGERGIEADKMPELGKLIDSPLGYYIRAGKHSMTREDWKVFLDYATKNQRAVP